MKTEQIMALARDYASDSGDSYYRTATDARYKSLQDAVEQLVQEREEYKIRMQRLMTTQLATSKERDTYQVEADKLAWENKTLRDALTRLRHWAEADNAHYTGDHPVALARAALQGANHD